MGLVRFGRAPFGAQKPSRISVSTSSVVSVKQATEARTRQGAPTCVWLTR